MDRVCGIQQVEAASDRGSGQLWTALSTSRSMPIVVMPTNVAISGLAAGKHQCRARVLGNPDAAGCVPLNVFGNGVASPRGDFIRDARHGSGVPVS